MKVLSMKVFSMKNIGALVALGLIIGTGSAVADTTTTPKLTVAEKAARKAATELHKASVAQFKSALASYRTSADSARATFKAAYESAKATREAAVKAATTAEAKSAARSAFTSTVAAAKATKDSAIAALGAKPVAPTKPAQ
jgi:hypothetical protein